MSAHTRRRNPSATADRRLLTATRAMLILGGLFAVALATGSAAALAVPRAAAHACRGVSPRAPAHYWYVRDWGGLGAAKGRFDHPQGIAVDASSNVYVADTENGRVQKFNNHGDFLTAFGVPGSGVGQFHSPTAIAVAVSGDVFVADAMNNRIQVWSPSIGGYTHVADFGSYGHGAGEFDQPNAIAVDAALNVFVVDTYNHRVQRFTPFGGGWSYAGQFGGYGTGPGYFFNPRGIALLGGDVNVSDCNNQRVQRFSPVAGAPYSWQAAWGEPGSGPGQFNYPAGIAAGVHTDLFVTQSVNNCVQEFSADGGFLTQFGGYGDGPGKLFGASGVAVSVGDKVYVADTMNSRVEVFGHDLVAPVTRALRAVRAHHDGVANLGYRVYDMVGLAKVTVRIKQGTRTLRTIRLGQRRTNRDLICRYRCALAPGSYTFWVYAVDPAGRPQRAPAGHKSLTVLR